MEAVVGDAKFGHEFECDVDAAESVIEGICAVVPWAFERGGTERVGAITAEGVPVADGKSQPVPHAAAFDEFGGVVVPEGERVAGLGAFELNVIDFRKKSSHGCGLSVGLCWVCRRL